MNQETLHDINSIQGVIKFVAIHNRALTGAQIQQNFAAGVGENLEARAVVLREALMAAGIPAFVFWRAKNRAIAA